MPRARVNHGGFRVHTPIASADARGWSMPFVTHCEACQRESIQRIGGLWCPWCRRWLNDPNGWRLLL